MIKLYLVKGYAGIAQLVEHLTCNEDVAGSSPVSSSIFKQRTKGSRPEGVEALCKSLS